MFVYIYLLMRNGNILFLFVKFEMIRTKNERLHAHGLIVGVFFKIFFKE